MVLALIDLELQSLRYRAQKEGSQIQFYNSRTHNRTSKDPRKSPEPASPDDHMSLDLRLNLPSESLRKSHVEDNFTKHSSGSPALGSGDLFMESKEEIGRVNK
ncbi:hypothetical protein SO802_032871 [Lithocarpus litseifolius]|uniref:Uncharacterized protein n=1 Tax=Lithocarpus litseifolius TaxID=425828 RepID=A0AAW2BBK3_9ROSI